uniref:Melanoregulin n=1 Tax=Chelydra serpentina TaxID=8475 RepID=A0A8C3SWY6_CHESE
RGVRDWRAGCRALSRPGPLSSRCSEMLRYFDQLGKRKRAQATNLWNEPADDTHTERDDDRELYNLLQKRARLRRGSEGYRRLSFDISAHRQIRREVKDRWRQILEVLGFSAEADALLDITSTASYSSLRQPLQARQLLSALAEQTSLFDRHCSLPERYLFVLVCGAGAAAGGGGPFSPLSAIPPRGAAFAAALRDDG